MIKITLSLPEDVERELRRLGKKRYGGRKGALSIIVTDALQEYFLKLKQEEN